MEVEGGADYGVVGAFSSEQRHAIVVVTQACATLSFLGSLTIVVANFRFKQVRDLG